MNDGVALDPVHAALLDAATASEERLSVAIDTLRATKAAESTDHHSRELFPLVFRRFRSSAIEFEHDSILKTAYRRTWHANQVLIHQAAPALDYLGTIGGNAVVLKGGAMVSTNYLADLGVRSMADLDVLVEPHSIGAVVDWMVNAGWSINAGPWTRDQVLLAHHAVDMVTLHGGAMDVHQALLASDRNSTLDEEFRHRAVWSTLGSMKVQVPAPTDLLTHTLAHEAEGVKHLADALILLRRFRDEVDLSELHNQLVERRSVGNALHNLDLLRQVDPDVVPSEANHRLERHRRHWTDTRPGSGQMGNRREAARFFVTTVRQRTRNRDIVAKIRITGLLAQRYGYASSSGSLGAKLVSLVVSGTSGSRQH